MRTFIADLRYGLRLIARNPSFSAVVILTLGLAIGANTAIFSVVNGVLFEPLPYRDPERLVRIWGTWNPSDATLEPQRSGNVNPVDALDWRDENRTFQSLALLHNSTATLRSGSSEPLELPITRVTANFFPMLGVQPQLGRLFDPGHEQPGNDRVVVLSHGFWQRRFGADSSVLGQTVLLYERPYTIIGVLPEHFRSVQPGSAGNPDLFRPIAIDRQTQGRGGHFMYAFARLRPGVTVAQAQSDIDAIAAGLAERFPGTNSGVSGRVELLYDSIAGPARRPLLILLAAAGFVLLIACVNVANLFLSRSSVRKRELSIRLALGARRKRLFGQLLTESMVLASCGGALGLALSVWLENILTALAGSQLPRLEEVRTDPSVLLFTAAAALVATLLFGFLPSLLASRTNVTDALKEGGRSSTHGRGGKRIAKALVVAEIALSLILLIGAGLMIRSFSGLREADPGIDPRRLVVIDVNLPSARYPEHENVVRFFDQVAERLTAVPGVRSVAAANMVPFGPSHSCDGYSIEGDQPVAGSLLPCAEARIVSGGYFETMGIRVLRGRPILDSDDATTEPVVVVTESMARRFPGGDALGKKIKWGTVASSETWRTVVGVAHDIRHFGMENEPMPEIYTAAAQVRRSGSAVRAIVVRTSVEPEVALPFIREAIWSVDRNLPLNRIALMEDLIAKSLARSRFRTVLVVAFAILALMLAATGIYGVMSYSVTSRTQEFGVLMALGAQQHEVLWSVLRGAAGLTGLGVALGLAGAMTLTPSLGSLLHDVSAIDPLTFIVVPSALALVAMFSSFIPALRATRVDPVVALRYE
ncbi:MAG TPA: ABC transporter permease [Thermoanaerobaculia bacterium]|nr:ABC transporter permease [Thermoanaerobaculia bacterium]